jgi:hypothetical protein
MATEEIKREGKVSQKYIDELNDKFTKIREWFLNPKNKKFNAQIGKSICRLIDQPTLAEVAQYNEYEDLMWSLSVDIMIHGTDANKSFMLGCAINDCMKWNPLTSNFTIVNKDDLIELRS